MSLNKQLLELFFITKRVDFDNQFLNEYYDSLFPSPQLFISFLSSYNREEQTYYAKKIIERMVFLKYNSSLYEMFNTLIDLEERNLADSEDSYIARDHSVHSVNMYLLGLYLYFAFSLFNKQIKLYFSSKNYRDIYSNDIDTNAFLSFFNSWTIFSLGHDIGYPFELLVDKSGFLKAKNQEDILEKYESISDIMANELAINEIVLFIGLQIVLSTSNNSLIDNLNSKEVADIKRIEKFDPSIFIKLENIVSNNIFRLYKSALIPYELCFIVTDIKTSSRYLWYYNDKTLLQFDFDSIEIEEISDVFLDDSRYKCDYYYNKTLFNKAISRNLNILKPYDDDIITAANKIMSDTTVAFAGITDESSYMDFLYEIYVRVKQNLYDELRIPTQDYYKKYVTSFNSYITKRISLLLSSYNHIDYKKPVKENLGHLYSYLIDQIYSPKAQEKDIINFLEQEGATKTFDIEPLFKRIKTQYLSTLSKYNKSVFLKHENNTVNYNYDEYFRTFINQYVINAYSHLCETSGLIDKKEKVDSLLNYQPDYAMFDHGVVSCLLLIENYFRIMQVNNSRETFSFRNHTIDVPNNKIFTTASYSILIHNIYSSYWKNLMPNQNGKHDLLKNPFVYFCLFCDNLQIWDRPYRVNQGKMELFAPSLSSRDISIILTKNKICIQCETLEAERIVSNFHDSVDEYLKDASKLISLSISEKH